MPLRFRVEPKDVPAHAAARRLGLTEADFARHLPILLARGFPAPDATTGHFDLDAIDEWRRRRHPGLFLTSPGEARDARAVVKGRLAGLAGIGAPPERSA
jgi:hypothetical protein